MQKYLGFLGPFEHAVKDKVSGWGRALGGRGPSQNKPERERFSKMVGTWRAGRECSEG